MQVMAQQELQRNSDQKKSGPDAKIIAEWPINRRETARVSIELYKGAWLINLRKWFEAEDGELRPTRHGVAFGVRHLPKLADAINKCLSIARERGLVAADLEGDQ
jgi:hypothetical protein